MENEVPLRTSAQRSILINDEKRAFESEAQKSIRRALESSKGEETTEVKDSKSSFRRASGNRKMLARAGVVSGLPPVIEEEAVKTLGFESTSSLASASGAPPKLKDIALRIQMIQRVSARRNSVNRQRQSLIQGKSGNEKILPNLGNGENVTPESSNGSRNVGTDCFDSEELFPDIVDVGQKACCGRFRYSVVKAFQFLKARKQAFLYLIKAVFYVFIPLLGIAASLFYIAGNPIGFYGAAYSWWILLIIRQCITFMVAQASQFFLIDIVVLETNLALMVFGRVATLIARQAKGWPTLVLFWSITNYGLLYGDHRHALHWLHDQSLIGLFNEANPGGTFTSSSSYGGLLLASGVCAFLAMIKRVLVAMLLGRKKYATYGPKMEAVMMKVLLISEVALLAEEIEDAASYNVRNFYRGPGGSGVLFSRMQSKLNLDENDDMDCSDSSSQDANFAEDSFEGTNPSPKKRNKWTNAFKNVKKRRERNSDDMNPDTKAEIEKLLDWVEPQNKKPWNDKSVRAILQFKETLNYMDTDYPLSQPFGLADTQKHCLESSQKVFKSLKLKNPGSEGIKFETLLAVALNDDGTIDKSKAKALKRLFRPQRNGDISLLDFIKTTDDVYRRVKMFRAKTLNSQQLDDAFEQLINIVFYFGISLVGLGIVGVDPFNVFISLTGILVPLAFLFNDAGSQYFQGLLLILVRQPYDIGDCISISDPSKDTKINGSTPWFVENITLFTTTIRSGPSNEVATIANGAIAKTRIINAARSPKAQVFVFLKLNIDIPYEKVKIFKTVVKEFIRGRPREWVQLSAIRAVRVEADQGYIEYEVVAQHVDSWQFMGQILQSRADLSSFCLEVTKQMGEKYVSPSMPVHVTITSDENGDHSEDETMIGGNNEKLVSSDISRLKALSNLFQPPPAPPIPKTKKK